MAHKGKRLLLLQDLCARLPYGVKLLVEGWDSDRDCKFDTETLIGIDDRFIYTIWDKTGDKDKHSIVEPLSILDYKPYLRPMSTMTEEEKEELLNHVLGGEGAEYFHITHDGSIDGNQEAEQDLYNLNLHWLNFGPLTASSYIDWLNKKMFDFRGLIPKSLALSTEEFNPYKD